MTDKYAEMNEAYGLQMKFGSRVFYSPTQSQGVIVGASGNEIFVVLETSQSNEIDRMHPTWNLTHEPERNT